MPPRRTANQRRVAEEDELDRRIEQIIDIRLVVALECRLDMVVDRLGEKIGALMEGRHEVDPRRGRVPNPTTDLEPEESLDWLATMEEDLSDDVVFVAGGDGEPEFDEEEEIVTGDGMPNLEWLKKGDPEETKVDDEDDDYEAELSDGKAAAPGPQPGKRPYRKRARDYDWKEFVPSLKQKTYEEIRNYGVLFLMNDGGDSSDDMKHLIPYAGDILDNDDSRTNSLNLGENDAAEDKLANWYLEKNGSDDSVSRETASGAKLTAFGYEKMRFKTNFIV
ncbi:hypothetical protein CDL15_Pgr005211 [Punica granatum]|uniref:CHD subfamily II SANT-like domain-containing protein n=1 Tax=Punica granatum TaxID=22663 RepID=A0A218WQZ3_PUNGR|nr:hypothetical protein CDL15_Pgr005211 [Punica granatum]